MTKIFISHATRDKKLAYKLLDLIQSQFNLTRDNFFLTSDEELEVGGNWIEDIRIGMKEANIILPLITPNFLESQFCLCELGAAWINEKALVPVIIPPLDHNALANTPYRSWLQAITLNSIKDLQRLADTITRKKVGNVNIVRFNTRAEDFYEEVLIPFINKMEQKETITPAEVERLKNEIDTYIDAFQKTDEELNKMRIENEELRKMKDAEEVKAYDITKINEWEKFIGAVEETRKQLNKLPSLVPSILYNSHRNSVYGGFIGEQEDHSALKKLENEGYITWDDGYAPDYEHPSIMRANQALSNLSEVIYNIGDTIEERFQLEFRDVRMELQFSPFWEKVLRQKIQHSN